MPEIHETHVHRVVYYPEVSLLKHEYLAKTTPLSWAELQGAFRTYIQFLKQYKPAFILVDFTRLNFIFHKEMQDWVNKNVVDAFRKTGIKKWAALVSAQLFSQVSIEQTMESRKDYDFETKYFDSEDEALKWLLNNEADFQLLEEIKNS